jgi:hypothetical protein
MGSSITHVVASSFAEAELAVYGEPHVGSVVVFLAVIFPPADRAELQGSGGIEGPVSAARATEADIDLGTHKKMDGKPTT